MQIYNSLTANKDEFVPIDPGKVRMYVCGMTVYDYCHLGHARVLVVFDMVARYLRARGFDVTYVRNVTDIDDKIIQRANENQESLTSLTTRFIEAMHEDAAALGVLPPDAEPLATEHIDEIVVMIEALMAGDHAYRAENGDVYYSVRSFPGYGRLSGRALEDLRAGARVEVDDAKVEPLDFALWKAAKPGEPAWDSPWGPGRPGWHIECSAMSTGALGNHFDIHGGGQDLRFPHHENEIAQSEGATGEPFVNIWMHNGFVRVNEEKMSKSLGNFFTIREILVHYSPEVVRYFILTSHYRSPLNYGEDSLEHAKAALTSFYIALNDLDPARPEALGEHGDRFFTAMDDDFNTPEAFAVLAELRHDINRAREAGDVDAANRLAGILRELAGILGLLQADPAAFLQGGEVPGLSTAEVEALIAERERARSKKDWTTADRIRDQLKADGILLEDAGGATAWRRG